MKSKLDSTTTPEQKMARFQSALSNVLQLSKDELERRIKADEQDRRMRKNKPGPKPSVSS